jgi:hypothetical protein
LAKFKFPDCKLQISSNRDRENGGNAMWDQYKKTFIGMQVVILLVTAGMFLAFSRDVTLLATFFVTLQLASLLGAYWGGSLRKRMRGLLG